VLVCLFPSLNPDDMRLKTILLVLAIAVLYALHQDVWFWRAARPLALGFLPPALWYHALYCIAAACLMWVLTKVAWPHRLADEDERGNPEVDRL
jgi:hypothetical protein